MFGFLVAALGVLCGAAKLEVRAFEEAAAREILGVLEGPNKSVNIQTKLNGIIGGPLGDLREVSIFANSFSTPGLPLYTEPDRSAYGRIGLLRIELTDFSLKGLRIESLSAAIPNCRYDYGLALRRRQMRLSRSGVGDGEVKILAPDLEKFILHKFKDIKRVSVKIDRDKVFVEGYGEFALITTNFLVIATLDFPDGNRLELANAKIFFDDRPADAGSSRILLSKLNPVVHFADDLGLHDAIKLKKVQLRDGVLRAWGDTKIPVRPAEGEGGELKAVRL